MPRIERAIQDFISSDRELPAVSADATVSVAADKMKMCRSECVLVLDGDALVGIFTQRDFLNRVVGVAAVDTMVREVMTPDPETLEPEHCISYAINKMAVGGFRNVPIIDGGKVVAVLTVRDVMGHLFDLFGELSDHDSEEINPWTDIGGG